MNKNVKTRCTVCGKRVPAGRVNKCSDACRKRAADMTRRKRWTAKLAKRLATALLRTWEMLPGDLSLVATDWDGSGEDIDGVTREEARLAFIEETHTLAFAALAAAERAGWKKPTK